MHFGGILIDLEGLTLTALEQELLQHPLVAGVILFSRNYDNPQQLKTLVQAIRASRKKPLLISVDQEGGRVQRFRDGFTLLPPMARFGEFYSREPEKALYAAEQCGWLMAREVLSHGLDISFAPVVDLDKGVNTVIGDRGFDHQPKVVSLLAEQLIRGMQQAGMQATLKHFPGHGSVASDSHHALPLDDRPYEQIEKMDMQPFQYLIQKGVAALMPAHIVFTQVDDMPVTFSRVWLRDILRGHLQFQGLIVSDDLSMTGAKLIPQITDRVKAAFHAGCDLVLVCNDREAVETVLSELSGEITPSALTRIATLYAFSQEDKPALKEDLHWQEAKRLLALMGEFLHVPS